MVVSTGLVQGLDQVVVIRSLSGWGERGTQITECPCDTTSRTLNVWLSFFVVVVVSFLGVCF